MIDFLPIVGPYVRMEAAKAFIATLPDPLVPLDQWVARLSPQIGFEVDIMRFLLCMVGSFPLALIHRELPNIPLLKHLFTALAGMFMGWFSFREEIFHTYVVAFFTYLLVLLNGRSSVTPAIVLVFNCLYLFVCHLHQQFSNWGGYKLDFTTVQMIVTIKLSQFAYNVYDGSRLEKASDSQKKWALKYVPSPLVFLAYLFYFPGLAAGPAFEITEYIAFTDLSLYKGERPSRLSAIVSFFKKLILLVFCFGMMEVSKMFQTSWALCDPSDEADKKLGSSPCAVGGLSNGYSAFPLVQRIAFLWVASALIRWKYYFSWTLADMASTLIGFGHKKSSDNKKRRVGPTDKLQNSRCGDWG